MAPPAVPWQALEAYVTQVARVCQANYVPELSWCLHDYARQEGLDPVVVLAQALHETNYFCYGGDVSPAQHNFAGIGAVGGGAPGHSFATPCEGMLAQVQHLKAYASTANLVTSPLVDPRFHLVSRGRARTLGQLAGTWAADPNYGSHLARAANLIAGCN